MYIYVDSLRYQTEVWRVRQRLQWLNGSNSVIKVLGTRTSTCQGLLESSPQKVAYRSNLAEEISLESNDCCFVWIKMHQKKKNKIGVTFSYKRLHFGNVCSQLNFLKLLESCHFNTNAGGGFLKILKGKKWDQIKRRDVELVDKKHKWNNTMFSFAKHEFLSKKVALHSLGLQLVTQKRQVFILVVLLRRYLKCVPIL